jgi:hypothetical protein
VPQFAGRPLAGIHAWRAGDSPAEIAADVRWAERCSVPGVKTRPVSRQRGPAADRSRSWRCFSSRRASVHRIGKASVRLDLRVLVSPLRRTDRQTAMWGGIGGAASGSPSRRRRYAAPRRHHPRHAQPWWPARAGAPANQRDCSDRLGGSARPRRAPTSSHLILQLAAAASRALPLVASPRDRLCRPLTRQPLPWSFAPTRSAGRNRKRAFSSLEVLGRALNLWRYSGSRIVRCAIA